MEYKFTQELNEKDYMAYVNQQLLSYFFRPINIALYVVIVGYLGFMLITQFSYIVLLMFAMIVLLNLTLWFYTKRRAKKFFKENQNLIRMTLTFKEDELVYKNTDGDVVKSWVDFTRVKESEEYFYLAVDKQSGLIIVKRYLSSEALAFFNKVITEKIDQKKLKLLKK